MLSMEPVIVDRLEGRLPAGWAVRGMTSDAGRRDFPLFASVEIGLGAVTDVTDPGVSIEIAWIVTLTVKRGQAGAPDSLDSAFAAVIAALHGWRSANPGGRQWARLQLAGVRPALDESAGHVGVALTFTTTATFEGQN